MSGKAERIAQTFNGKAQWIVAGGYFKLLETVNPVTVELFLQGQRVLYAAAAEGGFYNRTTFDRVEITTGANEAVAWFYGPQEGGQDRFSGSVSVTGQVDVSDRAARLLGVGYGNLGALAQAAIGGVNAAQVSDRGYVYGASYSAKGNAGANTAVAIVAPGSNVNGVIVWSASLRHYAGGAVFGALLAKTSAPASVTDGDALLSGMGNNGASNPGGQLERAVFVPAGKGIYEIFDAAQTDRLTQMKYTIL